MPPVPDVGGDTQSKIDSFIDESMEGSRDEFLEDDSDTEFEDGEQQDEPQDEPVDTGPEPELPLDHTQRQPADAQNPNGYQRVGQFFADKQGNIVNSQGRILATKGEAARHWVGMSKQAGQAANLQRQNSALSQQMESQQRLLRDAQEIASIPQKLGISREDYNEAMGILSKWSQNPVEVAREVVSRTLALGHNVTDIMGKTAGDALEMGAVRKLIDEATRGQRQQEAQRAQQAEGNQRAQAEYSQFTARYPDAELHGDAIANLMNTHKLSAVEAYHEVRHFAVRHGLDFNQPLGPQIHAARAQQQNGNGQRTPTQTQRAPMTPGASGGQRTMTTETQFADPSTDWSSILNSVLRESQ